MAKRILIVDDEPAGIAMSVQALQDEGYKVTVLENFAQYREVMDGDRSDFELLILDMLMPMPKQEYAVETESGTRTGRWILAQYRFHRDVDVPVLYFSRLTRKELLDAGWQAFENWCQRTNRQHPLQPHTAAGLERDLIRDFRTWVAAKADYRPTELVALVRSIIGPP